MKTGLLDIELVLTSDEFLGMMEYLNEQYGLIYLFLRTHGIEYVSKNLLILVCFKEQIKEGDFNKFLRNWKSTPRKFTLPLSVALIFREELTEVSVTVGQQNFLSKLDAALVNKKYILLP